MTGFLSRLFAPPPPPAAPAPEPATPAAPSAQALILPLVLGFEQLRRETLSESDLAPLIDTLRGIDALGDEWLTAGRMMTAPAVAAAPQDDWRALSALFVRHGFRSLPVRDAAGLYLGLIPVQAILRPGAQGLTAAHLAQECPTVGPAAGLTEIVPPFARGLQPSLPVLDAEGRLLGLLTRSDILAALVAALARS